MEEQPNEDQQPERLRDAIVRRALEAFVYGGYSRTSTDTISRMLGISKKTLYKVFPSKEEILRNVVRLATRTLEERTNSIYTDHATPVADRLTALVSQISPIYARIRSPQLLLDFQRAAPAIWEELRRWRIERYNALKDLLDEGVTRGEIRDDVAVDDIVAMYSILVDKCMDYETLEESSVSSLQLYQGLMELLLRGIYASDGITHETRDVHQQACSRSPVLANALTLFNQFGYSKTSSDQISRSIGISKRTLYEQFAKKSHIATTLLLHTAREVDRRCDPITFDDAASFRSQFHQLLMTYMSVLREVSPTFLDDVSTALPRLHRAFLSWRKSSIEFHIARALASGKRMGVITPAIESSTLIALVRLTLENVLLHEPVVRPMRPTTLSDNAAFTLLYDGMLLRTTQSQQLPKR